MGKNEKNIYNFLNEFWNSKSQDIETLHKIYSPNVIASSPLGNKIGSSNLKNANLIWLTAFPTMEVSEIKLTDSNSLIIAEWRTRGKNENAFNGYEATGKEVDYAGITFFQFEQERVSRYKCVINMLEVYNQLGFILERETYDNQHIIKYNYQLLISSIKKTIPQVTLSKREVECLSLFLFGWSAKLIGHHLGCTDRTVQSHIANVMDKLDCHSRHHLYEYFKNLGIVPLFDDLYKIVRSMNIS